MEGKELRRIRKTFGMTQLEFAKCLGYTNFVNISYLETGKAPITKTIEILVKMFQEFGIPEENREIIEDPNRELYEKVKKMVKNWGIDSESVPFLKELTNYIINEVGTNKEQ